MSQDCDTAGDRLPAGDGDRPPLSRPSRSGEGLDSVIQHLREHLADKARERARDTDSIVGPPSAR
jgi:hypothetical protein